MFGFFNYKFVFISSEILTFIGDVQSHFSIIQEGDWYSGNELCDADGKTFGVIENSYDTSLVYTLMEENGLTEVWIGLFYNVSLGTYCWTDGTFISTYQPWYADGGEPNCLPQITCVDYCNSDCSQYCIRVVVVGSTVLWRTTYCHLNYSILCLTAAHFSQETTAITTRHNLLTSTEKTTVTEQEPTSPTHELQETTVQSETSRTDGYDIPTSDKTTASVTGFRAIVYCPSDADSICKCEIIKNVTVIEENANLDSLLKIDKRKTSAFIRKHRSANDDRFSAKVMGYTGSAVLVFVALLVVCMDIIKVQNHNRR